MLNRFDKLILLGLLTVAAIGIAVNVLGVSNEKVLYAEIRVNNEIVKKIILNPREKENNGRKEYFINTPVGFNKVVTENGAVWVEESDCGNLECVHMGKISKPYQQIVCLPHKVSIILRPLDDAQRDSEDVDAVIR